MEVKIHKNIEALNRLLPKWEILQKEFRDITVFQDRSWLISWWEVRKKYGDDSMGTPYIVEISCREKVVGILPLYISKIKAARLNFRILKPIGSKDSDYLIPILSKEYSPETLLNLAFNKINKDRGSWDYFKWRDVPENSSLDLFLKKNPLKNYSAVEKNVIDVCPYLELADDFELVKPKIDQPALAQILKKERKLKNKGELTYSKVLTEQELEYVMEKFIEDNCKRWESTITPSRLESIEEREQLMAAAKSLLQNNLLHVTYMCLNDYIIAVNFGMVDGKRVYFYLQSMDLDYQKYSPGSILVYYLILSACKEGYEVFDFLRGAESYKKNWGAVDRRNLNFDFFNSSLRSTFYKNFIYSSKYRDKMRSILNLKVVRKVLWGNQA
jgi:CelD/BcsL family acetyltransferase involved in cellulose biosynthesis